MTPTALFNVQLDRIRMALLRPHQSMHSHAMAVAVEDIQARTPRRQQVRGKKLKPHVARTGPKQKAQPLLFGWPAEKGGRRHAAA